MSSPEASTGMAPALLATLTRLRQDVDSLRREVAGQTVKCSQVGRTLHEHADSIRDAATIVELEAASMLKADHSEVAVSVTRLRSMIEKGLQARASCEWVESELETLRRQTRQAAKGLQIKVNDLSNKFDGSVESVLIKFNKGIRQTLSKQNNSIEELHDEYSSQQRLVQELTQQLMRHDALLDELCADATRVGPLASTEKYAPEAFDDAGSDGTPQGGTPDAKILERMTQAESSIRSLQRGQRVLQQENEKLREVQITKDKQIERLLEQVAQLEERQDGVETRLASAEELCVELQQAGDGLLAQLDGFSGTLAELRQDIVSLPQASDTQASELARLTNHVDFLTKAVATLRERLSDRTRETMRHFTQLSDEFASNRSAVRKRLDGHGTAAAESAVQVDRLQSEVRSLRQTLNSMQSDVEATNLMRQQIISARFARTQRRSMLAGTKSLPQSSRPKSAYAGRRLGRWTPHRPVEPRAASSMR